MSTKASASWTMEASPEDTCWGAIIQLQTTDNKQLRLRCSTVSLRPFTPHNDAVVEVLLSGIAQELTELLNSLPPAYAVTVDIHGRCSSPFVNDLQRGIAFQYWLRVFDPQKHLYLMTHEHWHDDRNTLQCIGGLRSACVSWIKVIQALPLSRHDRQHQRNERSEGRAQEGPLGKGGNHR